MKRLLAIAVIVLLSPAWASAGPIVPKDIAADAQWFGHVNVEALRSMKLVQDIKKSFPGHERCQAKMEELSKQLGMNPMEDVLGATLYSNSYGKQIGVLLVYVKKLDRQKMVALLKEKHPDHKTSEYGGRTLYSWSAREHGRTVDLIGTFASDTLIVIGVGTEQVKSALDVLDGKKPGLAKDAPLLKSIPENALFASRGIDVPEDVRKTTRCPVIRNCKSAFAVWSEKDGQITGKYEFATVSEETAKNYKAVVEGFMAMGQLRYSDMPNVKKVLEGLKTDISGEMFTATFTTSTDDVDAAVKAVMEREKHRPMKRPSKSE